MNNTLAIKARIRGFEHTASHPEAFDWVIPHMYTLNGLHWQDFSEQLAVIPCRGFGGWHLQETVCHSFVLFEEKNSPPRCSLLSVRNYSADCGPSERGKVMVALTNGLQLTFRSVNHQSWRGIWMVWDVVGHPSSAKFQQRLFAAYG